MTPEGKIKDNHFLHGLTHPLDIISGQVLLHKIHAADIGWLQSI